MIHDALHGADHAPSDYDCEHAREHISARLDGELVDSGALQIHLARCPACRAHERALGGISIGFAALRENAPLPDLWARIERRARPRSAVPVLARVAAALVGFVGLGGTALLVERQEEALDPSRHLIERLAASAPSPDALFAALPEYRLLRALPTHEESR